jgi:hypothetical protein
MDAALTGDQLGELDDPVLHDLRQKDAEIAADLKHYLERIDHEFRSQFPKLEIVPLMSIEIDAMKEWLARHK